MNVLHRRHLISQALARVGAATQDDIVGALAGEGIRVTQATVSRDLGAIGAVKTTAGYRLANDLANTGADPAISLARALKQHSLSILPAASLVVVSTAPGHAGVVGDALDSTDLDEAVGVVAGDDTIFIATASNAAAAKLSKRLNALIAKEGGVS